MYISNNFKKRLSLGISLSVLAIILYSSSRLLLTLYIMPEYSIVENLFAWTLLLAEIFIFIHATAYSLGLIRALLSNTPGKETTNGFPIPAPAVAILVAARHEPKQVLESTFISISNIRYPNKTIYFLDDSSDKKYMEEAEEICKKYNLNLFRRKERHGAKAGIINDCLKGLKEKYIVIFDADQNPMPNFLEYIVTMMEQDEKIAFIQTPQFYSNIESSRVAKGASFQQAVFYNYICEGKSADESMFCCGTNVIIRAEALKQVGGMDESVVTEDFATSLKMHAKGWKSLYYSSVTVFGMGPESLDAYFKQQSRWAKGTIGVFRKAILMLIKNPLKLNFMQWFEYIISGSYYFVGIMFFFLMISPIAYILFDIPSFFINTEIYVSLFVPYFVLSLGIFFLSLGIRHHKIKDLFMGQILTYISFPIYIISAIQGLFGIQGTFAITKKDGSNKMPYIYLWPQITMMLLNFIGLVWGINKFYYSMDYSILINCFWLLYHWYIMIHIFYFNEDKGAIAC